MIAFGGAVIGLSEGTPNLLQLLGLVSAGFAALFAGVALWPAVADTIRIRELRVQYLEAEEVVTRLDLLDTGIMLEEMGEERQERKMVWTPRAAVPLVLAIVLVLAGAIVNTVHARDGRDQDRGGEAWERTMTRR